MGVCDFQLLPVSWEPPSLQGCAIHQVKRDNVSSHLVHLESFHLSNSQAGASGTVLEAMPLFSRNLEGNFSSSSGAMAHFAFRVCLM